MFDERQPFRWVHRQANDITRWNNHSSPRRRERKCGEQQGRRQDPRGTLFPGVATASVRLRLHSLIRGDPSEHPSNVADALPSFLRVLRKAAVGDVAEPAGYKRLTRGDGRRPILQDGGNDARRRLPSKRPRPGRHLVDDRAKRPDIAARISVFAFQLLRRHVLHGPENRPLRGRQSGCPNSGHLRHRARRRLQLCNTEIEQLRARLGQHDVCGLDVAVDDALAMRLVQGIGNFGRDLQRMVKR